MSVDSQQVSARCCWCEAALLKSVSTGTWWCVNPPCGARQVEWSLTVWNRKAKAERFLYVPLPKQVEFHSATARYVLFGGAAGSTKSHGVRWGLYRRCLKVPGLHALLLRRTYTELEQHHLHEMAKEVEWFKEAGVGANFAETKRMFEFPNGSVIRAGHMDNAEDVNRYLSAEFDEIAVDEGVTFDPQALLDLSTRARTTKPAVIADGGAKFRVATNPGGRANRMLLDFFIDHQPDFDAYPQLRKHYKPEDWVYIPALLDDNPYLPPEEAEARLATYQGWRYEQMRYGNWRVFAGQFFPEWNDRVHVRRLETDLRDFTVFCSMDWGYLSPGVILWWVALPDGHYHIVKEWKFQGLDDEAIAKGYKAICRELRVKPTAVYADPSMFAKDGRNRGQTRAETLAHFGVPMVRSNNDRPNGWARCRDVLRLDSEGVPWLTVDTTCAYGRRTIPSMVSKENDPEDVNTDSDDHWVDAWRYGAIQHLPHSRRRSRPKVQHGSLAYYDRLDRKPAGLLAPGKVA